MSIHNKHTNLYFVQIFRINTSIIIYTDFCFIEEERLQGIETRWGLDTQVGKYNIITNNLVLEVNFPPL